MYIALARKITSQLFQFLNRLQPFWWLFIRIWIAAVFFKSGLVKIDDFETTVALFADEYKVPLIPPYLAAVGATIVELSCPVFLTLGLGTRFAAIPMLVMTAVIEFTYLDHVQHYYWAMILTALILHGGGKFSVDRLIAEKLKAL